MKGRALVAGACIAVAPASGCRSETAVHRLDPDLNRMREQPRYDIYEASRFFPDGKAMREPPAGTVPYGTPAERAAARVLASGGSQAELPLPLTRELLRVGRRKFEQTCAACHGVLGFGETVVATHMQRPPPSLHEPRIASQPLGRLYQVIEQGYGFMPAYATQLDEGERWAVAAYVVALQQSQATPIDELPPALADRVRRSAP